MAESNASTVLVIGAGVGGIKAAIDLAEQGRRVLLAESSPALGGILSQLDYQFPNNHCGLCRMLPAWERDAASEYCMRKGLFHENIRLLPLTELIALEGEAGRFEATLRTQPRGVDPARCIGCGRCEEACPVEVPYGFNEGLDSRKAIRREVPHNLPFSYAIDFEHCTRCGECVTACPTEAVSLDGEPRDETFEVGALILAPGCGLYDPSPLEAYQYTALPDVVTSLEMERLLSGTGPTGGKLLRPSDGKPVERVAWIQCVGSRNKKLGQDYCSSVCCMFSLKEALLVKERSPETETTVFYMDMRTFGKEGFRYQCLAEDQGVEKIPCRVHAVDSDPERGLFLKYYSESDGRIQERPFDLVVLSTGQASTSAMKRLAEIAGVALNPHGFAGGEGFNQVATDRPGVFWCGSATGLKDITETVLQAESAACQAALLTEPAVAEPKGEDRVRARDVSREKPQVGLLLCRCFGGQGSDLPWDELREELAHNPDVAGVVEGDRLCQTQGFEEAQEALQGLAVNRLVIGACSPYVYDRRLRKLGAAIGLSEDLVDVVDLRGAGLGPGDTDSKRQRALAALAASVLKQKHREFPCAGTVSVIPNVLIVGGGLAGMTAALAVADSGVDVVLLEKAAKLGGETRRRRSTLEAIDPASFLDDLESRVRNHERIQISTGAKLTGLTGEIGRFAARVQEGDASRTVGCGAVILATGGKEAETTEYAFGANDRILRQGDLEARLAEGALSSDDLGRVVMIQCVGSREPEGRAYCSRICCASALKNAGRILEIHPDADIYVLYRDLMSYGFLESKYRELREKGVQFIRYTRDEKPEVTVEDDRVLVRFPEPVLGMNVEIHPDLLVLSTGVVPSDHGDLARIVGLELNEDGFFQEMDAKWRPVDLERPGVFACGLALAPRNMSETLLQARAAAVRAVNLLARSAIQTSRTVSEVRHTLCSVCETCIAVCPFQARYREKDRIRVIEAACQGCGICVAACPNGAARLPLATDRQTFGMLEGLLEEAMGS
jgi:heterodisulfide reductase subunit A2